MNDLSLKTLCNCLNQKDENGHFMRNPNCIQILNTIKDHIQNGEPNFAIQSKLELSQSFISYLLWLIETSDHSKDRSLVAIVLKLLVNITLPLENISNLDQIRSPHYRLQLNQFQNILLEAKKNFIESNLASEVLIKIVRDICNNQVESDNNYNKLEDYLFINDCLLFFYNLLYVPDKLEEGDRRSSATVDSFIGSQNTTLAKDEWQKAYKKILWNLLVQGLDSSILMILKSRHCEKLNGTILQLIYLFYKNQFMVKLQNSLNVNSSPSECSDDDNKLYQKRSSSASVFSDSSSSNGVQSKEKQSDSGFSQTESNNRMNNVNWFCEDTKGEDIKGEDDSKSGTTDESLQIIKTPIENEYQSSGFSTGSSEEEFEQRLMHKVIKSHQRSSNKQSESDSSDESPSTSKKVSKNIRTHHPPNVYRKSKVTCLPKPPQCCPSICLDAALSTAFSKLSVTDINQSSKNFKTLAPWDRKKPCGSKSLPMGNGSLEPSDDDICELLKDFTLKFVHSFFASFVIDLKSLLSQSSLQIDLSHFLWILSYFLKISISIDLKLTHLKPLLDVDLFNFLVLQGQKIHKSIQLSPFSHESQPKLKKLNLLIGSISDLVLIINNYYLKPSTSIAEKSFLDEIRFSLSQMLDLRQFPLLLIYQGSSLIFPRSLMIELILVNHLLLLLFKPMYLSGLFDMNSHLQQFANTKVIFEYGLILEQFRSNKKQINNCTLTLMHHIAGDLNAVHCLIQPIIIKTFIAIFESDFELFEAWSDLLEHVIFLSIDMVKKDLNTSLLCFQEEKFSNQATNNTSFNSADSEEANIELDDSDDEYIYWLYKQVEQTMDPIGQMIEVYYEQKNVLLNRDTLVSLLLDQKIITKAKFDKLLNIERQKMSDQVEGKDNDEKLTF